MTLAPGVRLGSPITSGPMTGVTSITERVTVPNLTL